MLDGCTGGWMVEQWLDDYGWMVGSQGGSMDDGS